jgi:hypothetical protein
VLIGTPLAIGWMSSCQSPIEDTCDDKYYFTTMTFVIGHQIVGDVGAGLAAGAGWHWSRWRRWQGRALDEKKYKRYAWAGVDLLVLGVAAEIVGASLWLSGWAGRGERRQRLSGVVAILGTGALLRGIGLGLATFGWGGQKWLKAGSGRDPRDQRRSRGRNR